VLLLTDLGLHARVVQLLMLCNLLGGAHSTCPNQPASNQPNFHYSQVYMALCNILRECQYMKKQFMLFSMHGDVVMEEWSWQDRKAL